MSQEIFNALMSSTMSIEDMHALVGAVITLKRLGVSNQLSLDKEWSFATGAANIIWNDIADRDQPTLIQKLAEFKRNNPAMVESKNFTNKIALIKKLRDTIYMSLLSAKQCVEHLYGDCFTP